MMLEMIKSDVVQTTEAIEEKYPGCMYIITDVGSDDIAITGKLYCVSHSKKTWADLVEVCKKIKASGISYAMLGIHDDGFAWGLQYVVKDED